MKSGRKGKIVEVSGGDNLKQRLMHMGIYMNRDIIKMSHLALQGPVTAKVGRTIIALGHGMAAKIKVEIE
ncbi:MAG: FeoA family protein [Candidatus Omnitrophota bacterium]|nr:FeoA family protein [Candidatus Omnitrophota bacterium]